MVFCNLSPCPNWGRTFPFFISLVDRECEALERERVLPWNPNPRLVSLHQHHHHQPPMISNRATHRLQPTPPRVWSTPWSSANSIFSTRRCLTFSTDGSPASSSCWSTSFASTWWKASTSSPTQSESTFWTSSSPSSPLKKIPRLRSAAGRFLLVDRMSIDRSFAVSPSSNSGNRSLDSNWLNC